MNVKEIQELIKLMNENELKELEIEKEGMRIKLSKNTGPEISGSSPFIIEREKVTPEEKPQEQEAASSKVREIKAPMVGTFYRSPSPETPAFAEVGKTIEVGEVICIIEAMKLMNEIKSEIKGKIVEVLVENAEPVEFDQAMFVIEPV